MRYFIKLSYHGKDFHGWQRQDNAISVQQIIEESLGTILKEVVEIIGCGRTDTGVHAKNFYAHFDTNQNIEEGKLAYQLNAILPKTIAIHSIFKVFDTAHARFSAKSRTYDYYLHFDRSPFLTDTSHLWIGDFPDIDLLNEASQSLIGKHDFEAFCKSNNQHQTYDCEVFEMYWMFDQKQLVFRVRANRFLRNMVRALVGTLMDVGTEKISLAELREIMQSKNRSLAGKSLPAQGLFLSHVEYPFEEYVL